jgi:putative transposase
MEVFGLVKEFFRLSQLVFSELSGKELDRLRALRLWRETKDTRLICDTFGMSRATLYRWLQRFNPHDLSSLREGSRRPRRVRKPVWSYELVMAVKEVRERYPRWGKDKLVVLLRQQGYMTSASTVGRVLRYLKRRGVLVEPVRRVILAKRRVTRPYAVRKPTGYKPLIPGDVVEVDTLDIRPLPGVILKQFTARDVISRGDVVEVRSRATAQTAMEFIETLQRRVPFAVRALQVDGGSEFYAEFEQECQRRGIRLFVLPPKSPKLNGSVERAHRTHTEEFYEVYECSWTVPELNQELRQWERIYNCVRPHQALGYKTPLQFLKDNGIANSHYLSHAHLSHM